MCGVLCEPSHHRPANNIMRGYRSNHRVPTQRHTGVDLIETGDYVRPPPFRAAANEATTRRHVCGHRVGETARLMDGQIRNEKRAGDSERGKKRERDDDS
ncbi:hypothetical protein MTO96_003707 [Rhipicephalus appendiculatus]